MILGTLAPSLLGSVLASTKMITTGEGMIRTSQDL